MMKKLLVSTLLLLVCFSAKAQFAAGTKFFNLSTSELNMSYNSKEKFKLDLDLNAGYFVADQILAKATVGYNHSDGYNALKLGVGGRAYCLKTGIFLGLGADYIHSTKSFNDLQVPVEIGYAFYINHYVTIEPVAYYRCSLAHYSEKSSMGIKLGMSIYLE